MSSRAAGEVSEHPEATADKSFIRVQRRATFPEVRAQAITPHATLVGGLRESAGPHQGRVIDRVTGDTAVTA